MRVHWKTSIFLTFLFLFSTVGTVFADGFIIPMPPVCNPGTCHEPVITISKSPLAVKEHLVSIKIKDQLAVTHVSQVFVNTGRSTVEGTYVFPLPVDAAVQKFTLWVNGKPVDGKVLTADDARDIYEDIVRDMRDPALLEYAGRGAVQASIFPFAPGEERKVELEYSQVLTTDNGLVRYSYPLNTEKFSARPLDKVSVTVELETGGPIRAVYSPSHAVDVHREGQTSATASYEALSITPDMDFDLFYSYGNEEALHLFTYRDARDSADPDGFFMLLAAPSPEAEAERVDKDVLLVLDRSGSMDGEKIRQAKSAAQYVLSHLGPRDRFHITTFNSRVDHFSDGLSPVEDAGKARNWVDTISAGGSTDINRALLESVAAADMERPTYLIFLTDGLPTVGVRESAQILKNFSEASGKNIRLFPFGVGFDVDTLLLDSLGQQHHGASTYVDPNEALDLVLSAFYEKISTPVLTNIEVQINGVAAYDTYPYPLPDLFQGSQLVITGRYREGGQADILLRGLVNDKKQEFRYPSMEFTEESPSRLTPETSLPRLWAARKIGNLLNQIRLEGNEREIVDQIVKLSIRYGIVTPYTSYLVTEPLALGMDEQEELAERTFSQMQAMPSEAVSGADAVQKARGQNELAQSLAAPTMEKGESENQTIKTVGARTFVLKDNLWVDTAYDPGKMNLKKVRFLSADYFDLTAQNPGLAACLAVGTRVLVVDGNQAIEIVE